ncbi:aldehyde dehydrogenase family protein [Streptomyces sp. NPDC002004]
MNPVNAYLRPHFEQVFAEFVARDWVRFVDGGAAEGAHLTRHEGVDSIHVTGSGRTHDAIVWDTGEDAVRRRNEDRPLVGKPFSSELGGVSSCIVTPGPWSDADFRFQAEHIVSSKMNNSGHNCIASQVLVVSRDWDGTVRLLDEIRRVLQALPPRTEYYPGADRRLAAVRAAPPAAETYGDGCRLLVPDVTGDVLITDEVFASALGVVRLPGTTTPPRRRLHQRRPRRRHRRHADRAPQDRAHRTGDAQDGRSPLCATAL